MGFRALEDVLQPRQQPVGRRYRAEIATPVALQVEVMGVPLVDTARRAVEATR